MQINIASIAAYIPCLIPLDLKLWSIIVFVLLLLLSYDVISIQIGYGSILVYGIHGYVSLDLHHVSMDLIR